MLGLNHRAVGQDKLLNRAEGGENRKTQCQTAHRYLRFLPLEIRQQAFDLVVLLQSRELRFHVVAKQLSAGQA